MFSGLMFSLGMIAGIALAFILELIDDHYERKALRKVAEERAKR